MDRSTKKAYEKEKRRRIKEAKKLKVTSPKAEQTFPIPGQSKVVTESSKKENKFSKFLRTTLGRLLAFLGGVGLIVGIVSGIISIRDSLKSTHEKYQEENFATGEIKPLTIRHPDLTHDTLELNQRPIFNKAKIDTFPPINGVKVRENKGNTMVIVIGSGQIVIGKDALKKGIKIFNPDASDDCGRTALSLILHEGRIYASAEFRDLQKEEIVGSMAYNRWKLFLPNLLDYDFKDDRLEVKDKQGYIIFSILFSDKEQSPNGAIALSGYFISPNSVFILNTDPVPIMGTAENKDDIMSRKVCITKDSSINWRAEAEKRISKIVSVFDRDNMPPRKGVAITFDDTVINE